MREYNGVQGRWWTPDPAGLAAVDPNNPQSWNRYAYVGGHPLGSMDPLGLWPVPCTSASLHKPSSDAQAVGFGPYEPDEDGASAESSGGDDCGSGGDPWQQCSLDGVDMGCGTMWDLGSGGGALPGGGGIPGATLTSCPWYACQPTVNGHDGNPVQTQPVMVDFGKDCSQISGGPVNCTDQWGPGWAPAPPGQSESCGTLNFGCQFFAGFVDLFLNNQPSGALQMAGAEAGVGAPAVVGAAVGPFVPAALEAVSQIPSLARATYFSVYTNPELIEATGQFVDGFNPLGAVPTTQLGWIGLGLGTAYTIYDIWGH